MRLFRLLCPVIGLLFAIQFNAHAQGYVIEKTTDKKVTPIAVDSSDSSTEALAKIAFNSHGAFRLVKPSSASAVIKLTPVGGNQCNVKVVSGNPAQVLFQDTATGDSANNATLRACDMAVKALTNAPGYFAGTIAFVADRTGGKEIWMGDVFFRTAKPVTSDKANAQRPYLTPDGRTLFYRSYMHRFSDVYKQDVASGRRTVFAKYKGTNAGGAVSPDGQNVALILSSPGNSELFIQDINQSRKPRRLTTNRYVEADPTWSPDGRRLIVTSDMAGGPQLYEIPSQGGVPSRLPTNISGYCAEANWNPVDASKIAFTANMGGGYEIALYEFGQGAAKALTSVSGNAMEPVWLNDGRHLIYTEEARGGATKLVILDSETGKRTVITPSNFGNASQAAFVY
ncbi:hypothetical protein [Cerasicoccus fimbriatus]|uniref:hypothetical protein n=1 Tax=Cerasicoccus fimbriatus TaxID=3014554 RepID=UPI0022B4CA6A|nr:hypothetical protein [Cerasicoccus sp. TK19100]